MFQETNLFLPNKLDVILKKNEKEITEERGNYHIFYDEKKTLTTIYFYNDNILILLFKEKFIDGTIHDLIINNEIDWNGKKLKLQSIKSCSQIPHFSYCFQFLKNVENIHFIFE